jgi:hypothetical protein
MQGAKKNKRKKPDGPAKGSKEPRINNYTFYGRYRTKGF